MMRSNIKRISVFALLLCCTLYVNTVLSALGGNVELNNNYFGHLDDFQRSLLKNNENHHLKEAITMMASGKPWEIEYVKQNLTYLLPRWPNHPRALQLVSEVAIRTHDPAYAIEWFNKAIDAFPRVYQTYVLYGVFLYRINEYSKAEENFRKAEELNPDSSEANYNLGLALFAQHKYKQANRYAQRAYSLGYPLDGLRKLLKKQGAWKPVDSNKAQQQTPGRTHTESAPSK